MTFFTIPGKPQGKARARTVYNPEIHRTVSYTPDNTMLYENLVKTMYLRCKKPDIDNIAKVILDALNGIAYRDDTQVVSLSCQKQYAEEARVEVEIESMVGILP